MSKFYVLSVKNIGRETHNSVVITFEIPDSLQEVFSFIPGQYLTIQAELNGEQIRRDYSICSSKNSGEIKIGVKAVENGTFSQYATTKLQVGDTLEVAAPQGRFQLVPQKDNAKNYMAFAAGSGITPVLSLLASALEIEPQSNFVLVYGNKTQNDAMFKSVIDAYAETYKDRFFIHYVFSQSANDGDMTGRIDETSVQQIIDKYSHLEFSDYFLCGPEGMINKAKETILNNDVDTHRIHFELFTTPTGEDSEVSDSLEGESEITVLLDDEEETFTMSKQTTILEEVLLKGMDAPYSCQGGICSSCLAKVTHGKAVMDKNTILSEEEVAEGLILTCQAHPVTSKITIDYDDV